MKNFVSKILLGLLKPILKVLKFFNSIAAIMELAVELFVAMVKAGYDYITSTAWWKKADNFCIELSELYVEIWDLVERTGLINPDDSVRVMTIKIVWGILHTINIAIFLTFVALIFMASCEPYPY